MNDNPENAGSRAQLAGREDASAIYKAPQEGTSGASRHYSEFMENKHNHRPQKEMQKSMHPTAPGWLKKQGLRRDDDAPLKTSQSLAKAVADPRSYRVRHEVKDIAANLQRNKLISS